MGRELEGYTVVLWAFLTSCQPSAGPLGPQQRAPSQPPPSHDANTPEVETDGAPTPSAAMDASVSAPQPPLTPTVLVTGVHEIFGIALSDDFVYFTRHDDDTVQRVALNGGTPRVLASGQDNPHAVAVSDGTVFWTNVGKWPGSSVAADGSLMKLEPRASSPVTLAKLLERPIALTVDATHVYVALTAGTIAKVPRSGGRLVVLARRQASPVGIAVDAHRVYWTSLGRAADRDKRHLLPRSGSVRSVLKHGGTVSVIATKQPEPTAIALESTHVYWSAAGTIARAPKVGGRVETMGGGASDRRQSIVLHDGQLIYTIRGIIRAMPTATSVVQLSMETRTARTRFANAFDQGVAEVRLEGCFDPGPLAAGSDALVIADVGCGRLLRADL